MLACVLSDSLAHVYKGLNELMKFCKIQDIHVLEQGHILKVHATAEALLKALPYLSRDFGVINTSDIDICSLQPVRGARTPSPSVCSEDEAPPSPLYTFTMQVDPLIRGPLIGRHGANLCRLNDDLRLPTYPVIDHTNTLYLLGTQQQIESAIERIEGFLTPNWIDFIPSLDPEDLREVRAEGEQKDWRVFSAKMGPNATNHLWSKSVASVEWLAARFDLVAVKMYRTYPSTGELLIKVSCLTSLPEPYRQITFWLSR